MAQAYDYFWSARLLVESGADEALKNKDGHAASTGIDGDMIGTNWIAAMTSAHTGIEIEEAVSSLEIQIGQRTKGLVSGGSTHAIDKVDLVMGGMAKKRSSVDIWTKEIDQRFKLMCQKL